MLLVKITVFLDCVRVGNKVIVLVTKLGPVSAVVRVPVLRLSVIPVERLEILLWPDVRPGVGWFVGNCRVDGMLVSALIPPAFLVQ